MSFYILTFDAQYADDVPSKAAARGALKILKDAGVNTTALVPSRDGWRYSPVELTIEQAEKVDKGLSGSQGFYMEGPFWERKAANSFWHNGSRD